MLERRLPSPTNVFAVIIFALIALTLILEAKIELTVRLEPAALQKLSWIVERSGSWPEKTALELRYRTPLEAVRLLSAFVAWSMRRTDATFTVLADKKIVEPVKGVAGEFSVIQPLMPSLTRETAAPTFERI
jgi:hypothetical protein